MGENAREGQPSNLQAFISRTPDRARGGNGLAHPRWNTREDFLSDLPVRHCATKPQPEIFCTICYRINYNVAFDCPLREVHVEPAHRPAAPAFGPAAPFAAPGVAPWPPAFGAPPPPPEMPEGPVIEFAREGEVPPKRRVKAKAMVSRGPLGPPPPPMAPPPPPNLSEQEALMAEMKSWESPPPAAMPPTPPSEEGEKNRPHRTPRAPKP